MEFRYDEIDRDVMIITADGGLNQDTAEQFVQSIEKLVDTGLTQIIVDCSELSYISSYGLGVLIRLHKRMEKQGGDIKIAGVKGLIAQALQVTSLNKILAIYPDVNRARLAFRPTEDAET